MYKSYFQFFQEMKSIAADINLELSLCELTGNDFDKLYNNYLNKMVSYCKEYSDDNIIFKGNSKIIAEYISEIRNTKTYPQSDRARVLVDVTENYIKKAL